MWGTILKRICVIHLEPCREVYSTVRPPAGWRGYAAAAARQAKEGAKSAVEGAGEGAKNAADEAPGQLNKLLGSLRSVLLGRGAVLLVGGTGFVAVNYFASKHVDQYYRDQVYRTLERGFCPEALPDEGGLLERRELRQRLLKVLRQDEPAKCYFLITGPNGNGKSTLLKDIVRSISGGIGYMEVDPLPEVDFGKDLGAAINFNFEDHLTAFNAVSSAVIGSKVKDNSQEHELQGLKRAAESLTEGARRFRKEHGRPFVLVIDNSDRLAAQQPRVLQAMQDYAKDWSQENIVTVVFVCGASTDLQERSSWSRAFEPIEVSDITDAEAASFLRRRAVDEKSIPPVVQVAGGRLELLEKCAIMLSKGIGLPAVQCEVMRQVEPDFIRAGLLDNGEFQAAAVQVVQALLATADDSDSCSQPGISHARWRQLMPTTEGQELLTKHKIVSEEFRRVTFHSRAVQVYAEHMLPERLSRPDLWKPMKQHGPNYPSLSETLGPQA